MLKKRRLLTAFLLAVMIISLTKTLSMAKPNISMDTNPEIKVVCTTTILADFAGYIIGDKANVTTLIEGGMCPGHYDYQFSDIAKVQEADIIFYHSFENSYFLGTLLDVDHTNNSDAAYSLFDKVGFVPWGPPANAIKYLAQITTKLNLTYPSSASHFNTRFAEYQSILEAKKIAIQELVNDNYYNFTGKKA
ncbi:MAG: metal ABC transporter solute-binding protein, Zn/Mn family [Candidatus Ranarchaeia archaeon]